jgi:hypothetical protein
MKCSAARFLYVALPLGHITVKMHCAAPQSGLVLRQCKGFAFGLVPKILTVKLSPSGRRPTASQGCFSLTRPLSLGRPPPSKVAWNITNPI